MKRHAGADVNSRHRKDEYISVPEAQIKKKPIDVIVEIESARIRLGVKKRELCEVAGIKAEMLSYAYKRGRQEKSLPGDCIKKLQKALVKIASGKSKNAHE